MNVCLYVSYTIVNYAFDYVMHLLRMSQGRFLSWYDQFQTSELEITKNENY